MTSLFWSRAKFENYFSSRAALLEKSYNKVVISAKQKKIWSFLFSFQLQLLTKFLIIDDLYVAFSHSRKSLKGHKNKSEDCIRPAGRTLAMSAIYSQTWGNYHFWITIICLQQPTFWIPTFGFYNRMPPLNNDHLSIMATKI